MSRIPDCGVKLEGEDDVVVMADLADEATLGAQVTVVDVLGSKSNQGVEEPFIHSIRDLWRASAGRQAFRVAVLRLRPSIKCGLLLLLAPCLKNSYSQRSIFPLGQEPPPPDQAEQCRCTAPAHGGHWG